MKPTHDMPLHPDDFLFFKEVESAMRKVAKQYQLPLRSVSALKMPESGMADRKGECTGTGDIRLVMRCTVDGVFCAVPRSPEEVWNTAAHELAHLRYMDHGLAFQELRLEMIAALKNRQDDHRQKVLDKLVKMQDVRDGEAKLGNSEAAEAFAAAINRMLIENELAPSDIDYARGADRDPVIEVPVNLKQYGIESKKSRVAWQESLARVVAKAHLCKYLIQTGSNRIYFVGTRSHATVAEYAFGTLVPAADAMSEKARWDYRYELRRQAGVKSGERWSGVREIIGFREAWLDAFINRIGERFDEARQAVVVAAPEGTSTALMRLDGALRKAQQYVDDKFASSKRRVAALNSTGRFHAEGRNQGRAAADRMTIGRKGVTAGNRGLLNS